jgi:hypothetical protein
LADGDHDQFGPGNLAPPADQENQHEKHDSRHHKEAAETAHAFFEGRGGFLNIAGQARDLADLRIQPSSDDDGFRPAGRHEGPRKNEVSALGERGLLGQGPLLFRNGHRLARQGSLTRYQRMSREDASVGRNRVARVEQDEVSRHEFFGGHQGLVPVASHARRNAGEFAKRLQRALGLTLLNRAHDGVQDYDDQDDECVAEFTHERRAEGGNEQKVDQGALELMQRDLEQRLRLPFWNRIFPEPSDPLLDLGGGQPKGGINLNLTKNFSLGGRVPGDASHFLHR